MNESLQRITFCMVNIADPDLAFYFASDWVAYCLIKHANLVVSLCHIQPCMAHVNLNVCGVSLRNPSQ